MIEVKLSFATIADMLAHFACTTQPALTGVAASATITAEKQAAAIASTAAGKKAAKDAAPKNPETPVEALAQAVEKTAPARVYETSGLAEKIAKAVAAKGKEPVIALLVKHKAVNAEGKPNGKALPVDAFDAFEVDIDALMKPTEDLG